MVGCSTKIRPPITINEIKQIGSGKCIYFVRSAPGFVRPHFITECGTYNIGDTIK